jgi:hypothetical protein
MKKKEEERKEEVPRPSSPRACPADAPTVTEPPTSVGKVYPPFLRLSAFVPLCLSAFMPFVSIGLRAIVFCRFWKPPCAGEVLPKF